jgi:hypothetical protein
MDCLFCDAKNPEGAKYCNNCGSRLDLSTGPVKEVVEAAVRQEVNRVVERRLKDEKIAEFDITEKVTNRLLGWAKILGTIMGVLLVLAGILGVKSGYDIKKELNVILRDIRQQTKTVKDEIAAGEEELKNVKSQDAELRQEYERLRSALPEYEQIRDKAQLLDKSISEIQRNLTAQAKDIEVFQDGLLKLLRWQRLLASGELSREEFEILKADQELFEKEVLKRKAPAESETHKTQTPSFVDDLTNLSRDPAMNDEQKQHVYMKIVTEANLTEKVEPNANALKKFFHDPNTTAAQRDALSAALSAALRQ